MLELKVIFSATAKIWLCPEVQLGYRFNLKLSRLFSFLNEKEERPQTKLKADNKNSESLSVFFFFHLDGLYLIM